ncbi:lysophospholipid acyltransferase family protein [Sinomicrobium sp. FJxs]|uniref:Lysophospholipid acyltransferase family protein n=2 Tax=Sinomicrobium weinanense TaxID=2842200 RepID=A0A926Q2V4_9FLAO|nr:lysophospholipid acyltransferase family protein [Sinomicrobium weinanense]MBU3122944.1 lysophospholipid acyltransferase family protein [Sinomicrobium weinanense]
MQLLVFILAYPLLWIISQLPFRLLYVISDVVYFILYKLIGYRKKTVRTNLKLALPERSAEERLCIEKKFYRHFGDVFLEMIKSLSVSKAEIKKRYTFTNIELIQKLEKEKSIILLFPHYANWEWSSTINLYVTSSKGYAVYQRIQNKYFNNLVKNIREKNGTTLIETRETIKVIRKNQINKVPAIYGFLSDQSPQLSKAVYWQEFMGIKVPVHIGPEVLAKRADLTVLYMHTEKIKRGYYRATLKTLTTSPATNPNYQITDMYIREVEKQIKEAPEYYFWTHKRWKHKGKAPKD